MSVLQSRAGVCAARMRTAQRPVPHHAMLSTMSQPIGRAGSLPRSSLSPGSIRLSPLSRIAQPCTVQSRLAAEHYAAQARADQRRPTTSLAFSGFFSPNDAVASTDASLRSDLALALVPIPTALPAPLTPTGPNPLIRWRPRAPFTLAHQLTLYRALAKARLSALVVLTTMAGYAMCPVEPGMAFDVVRSLPDSSILQRLALASSPEGVTTSVAASLHLMTLAPATAGTALCSFAAASFNELIEAPYDAQMTRTRGRPLPRRALTPLHAAAFGGVCGVTGTALLASINPLAGALGLGTILLYFPLYTLAKRHTVFNTWLGSVLGAIPPLIGWAACTGSISPLTNLGAYPLFLLLYFWQFPHFNALAHTVRASFAASGYRMLAVLDPHKNALVSLRYALAMLPLSVTFPVLGLTTWAFPILALAPNAGVVYYATRFYRRQTDERAKKLFWSTLIHLPVVLGLAMVCKKGLWGEEEAVSEASEASERSEGSEAAN